MRKNPCGFEVKKNGGDMETEKRCLLLLKT
jgi:hypothetical protein